VVWTNLVGVSTSGSTLLRTAATRWRVDRGRGVDSGDRFRRTAIWSSAPGLGECFGQAGLSNGDSNQSDTDIDYALYLDYWGHIYVNEFRPQPGPGGDNTSRRICCGSALKTEWSNTGRTGRCFTRVSLPPTYPLLVDTSPPGAGRCPHRSRDRRDVAVRGRGDANVQHRAWGPTRVLRT
jgi:hypothetical protein